MNNWDNTDWELQEAVESLLNKEESFDIEYKSAAGGFPGSFWETYSSFANTEGGIIVLGVSEKKEKLHFDNLTHQQVTQYKKDFWSGANNKNTINLNLLQEKDVQELNHKGNTVLVFHIPNATWMQKPIYRTPNPFNGNTYKRNNEGDFKCSDEEVRRMFADASISTQSRDSRILQGYSMDDIDMESLNQYRMLFSAIRPGHAWLQLPLTEFLKRLGGYRKSRTKEEEGLTVAGILMFGKYQSIIDAECLPNYFPDYQEYFLDIQSSRWSNRIWPDGTWEPNLFQFYRKVLPKLQSVLPQPFKLVNNTRVDETATHIALRESFVNCLIHADININASITIKQYPDKIIFSNPGTLLISKAQYYAGGGESICRNKALQTMFTMIGSAEKAGSGVDKIFKGWKEANWRHPNLEESFRPDKIVLTLPMKHLLPDETIHALKDIFGESITSIENDALVTLATCYLEGTVTNDRLKYTINKHRTDISRLLSELCSKGYLQATGRGRGTKYVIHSQQSQTLSLFDEEPKVGSNEPKVGSNESKKRISKKELESLILEITKNEYLSLNEIAVQIGKSRDYLQNKIIPEMVKQNLLQRMYPGAKSPVQKYKAKNPLN